MALRKPKHKSKPGPKLVETKAERVVAEEFHRSRALRIVSIIAILVVTSWLLLALFSPGPEYKLVHAPSGAIGSPEFIHELRSLADAGISRATRVDVLANGENFYEAEVAAIRAAERTINLEAYIFHKGEATRRVVEALTERARAGVKVNLVLDAMGSFSTPKHYFKELRSAGGHVEWYHPVRWNTWVRSNNRTHRELLVVDGQTAFLGGAGFADHWLHDKGNDPRWRDTMFRVQGEAVAALQGTFVENWLESSGQILAGDEYFPTLPSTGAVALVVNSSPSTGGSTRARILFQALVAAAQKTILITTPYFLPDRSMRDELLRAIRERGVKVEILVPGKRSDHGMTRSSSRRLYGDLLAAGADIYEYQPAMIHAKILIVDGMWSVVGSTNLDNRSFGLNDEVNLAMLDTGLAERLIKDFERDLAQSQRVPYEEWKQRPVWERAQEWAGFVLQRQQ
jgi:cardiolipin synthase